MIAICSECNRTWLAPSNEYGAHMELCPVCYDVVRWAPAETDPAAANCAAEDCPHGVSVRAQPGL